LPKKVARAAAPPEEPREVRKTTLPNGLRIVTEAMPHVRSVAVGVWVGRGSRHETGRDHGITHFIEHMVFKGTENRSAEDIAFTIDGMGGHLDAFTTKETVAFTVKALDERLPEALDILADMTLRPAFRDDDIEKEKGVILEELKMDEDNPDYLLGELFYGSFWRGGGLGRSILGTKRSIRGFQREQVRGYYERAFQPGAFVVTAAGRLDHEAFVAEIAERFGGMPARRDRARTNPPAPRPEIVLRDKPSLEQVHLCLGCGAHPMADPRRFVAYVLSTILGGGFSSRLFMKIRERAGLAYSVYSDLNLYVDAGCLSVCAGTSLEATPKVVGMILEELREMKRSLVPADELRRAKDHLKGSLLLSLESTSSRMSNLARQERYFGRIFSLDETAAAIEAVTADEVAELAREWFQPERLALTVLGALDGYRVGRDDLVC
jgi:predicted Zn-dependent peptidase